MATSDQPTAVVRQLFEAVLQQGDLDALEALAAPDIVDHSAAAAGWAPGRAGFRQHVVWFRGLLADLQVTVDQLVAEGEWVVVCWTASGRQVQPLFGIPATGTSVRVAVVSTVRVRDGRIVAYHPRPDRLGFLQQVGAVIRPPIAVAAPPHPAI
jgi:steroid delta-isomerase-like uncharacterized protein